MLTLKERRNRRNPFAKLREIGYPDSMEIKINVRDNGACPMCRYHGKCTIQKLLRESTGDKIIKKDDYMELVIYRCPQFAEDGPRLSH